jgi:hypothetical protein
MGRSRAAEQSQEMLICLFGGELPVYLLAYMAESWYRDRILHLLPCDLFNHLRIELGNIKHG